MTRHTKNGLTGDGNVIVTSVNKLKMFWLAAANFGGFLSNMAFFKALPH
jgi:hypothetical protein